MLQALRKAGTDALTWFRELTDSVPPPAPDAARRDIRDLGAARTRVFMTPDAVQVMQMAVSDAHRGSAGMEAGRAGA